MRSLAAFLALLLSTTSAGAFERWVWDPVPTADGYRFYWSNVPLVEAWYDTNEDGIPDTMYLVVPDGYPPWSACQMVETALPETTFDPPAPGENEVTFITVTAFNAVGESGTGWAEGTTHGPITPCPQAPCPEYPLFPCG